MRSKHLAKRPSTKQPMTVKQMAAMGGRAAAAKRTPEQRQTIARNAVQTRWARFREALMAETVFRPDEQG